MPTYDRFEGALPRYRDSDVLAAFMRGVYGWMCGGLAITAATAWFVSSSPALVAAIFGNRLLFWILGVPLAAGCAAALPRTATWPLPAGLGGVVGDWMAQLPSMLAGGPLSNAVRVSIVIGAKGFVFLAGTQQRPTITIGGAAAACTGRRSDRMISRFIGESYG